jgi:hypothetical protein
MSMSMWEFPQQNLASGADKGNNYNYFGKDTGKGINLTDVFISNDIDDILIVQYTEEAQYIGVPKSHWANSGVSF